MDQVQSVTGEGAPAGEDVLGGEWDDEAFDDGSYYGDWEEESDFWNQQDVEQQYLQDWEDESEYWEDEYTGDESEDWEEWVSWEEWTENGNAANGG